MNFKEFLQEKNSGNTVAKQTKLTFVSDHKTGFHLNSDMDNDTYAVFNVDTVKNKVEWDLNDNAKEDMIDDGSFSFKDENDLIKKLKKIKKDLLV